MRRSLKRGLLSLTVLGLLALLLSPLFLLGTHSGSLLLLSLIQSQLGDTLKLGPQPEQITGNLLNGLGLEELLYDDGEFKVAAEKISLQISPSQLLRGRLGLPTLTAQQIIYSQTTSDDNDENDETDKPFTMPFVLQIAEGRVEHLQILVDDSETLIDALALSAQLDDDGIHADFVTAKLYGVQLTVAGTFGLQDAFPLELDFKAKLGDTSTDSPLAIDAQGQILGNLDAYQIQASGQLVLEPGTPYKNDFTLSSTGNLDGLATIVWRADIQAKHLQGQASGSGSVSWAQDPQWQIQATLINGLTQLAGLEPPLPITAELGLSGSYTAGQVQHFLDLKKITSQWQERPIQGQAKLQIQGDHYVLENLDLQTEENHFLAKGQVKDQWALEWRLQIPDMTVWDPNLAGQFFAQGALQGPREKPQLIATANASELRYQTSQLEHLLLEVQGDLDKFRLNVQANQLQIEDYRLARSSITITGDRNQQTIELTISGQDLELEARASGKLNAGQWQADWQNITLQTPRLGAWQLSKSQQLPQIILRSDHLQLSEFCLQQQQTRLCQQLDYQAQTGWRAQGFWQDFPAQHFTSWLPQDTHLKGAIEVQWSFLDQVFKWQTRAPSLAVFSANDVISLTDLEARGQIDAQRASLDYLSLSRDLQQLTGQANLSFSETSELSATLAFTQSEPELSAQLKLNGSGQADAYHLTARAQTAGAQVPKSELFLEGLASRNDFRSTTLILNTLEGSANGSLNLNWLSGLDWRSELEFSALNPGSQWPDFQGQLTGKVTAIGSHTENLSALDLRLNNFSGHLRDHPLSAELAIKTHNKTLQLDTAKLKWGGNRAEIQGGLSTEQFNLRWQVAMPALDILSPDLRGNLVGNGQVLGSVAKPILVAELLGQELWLGDTQLSSLTLQSNYTPDGGVQAQLALAGLNMGGQQIQQAQATLKGEDQQHQWSVDVKNSLAKLSLAGSGRYDEARWEGHLNSAQLNYLDFEPLKLQQAAKLSVSATESEIEEICLSAQTTQLCAHAHSRNTQLRAQGNLQAIPFKYLRPWLPNNLQIDGLLAGQWSFQQGPTDAKGKLDIASSQGRFRYLLLPTESAEEDDQAQIKSPVFNYQQAELHAELKQQTLLAKAGFVLPNKGELRTELSYPLTPESQAGIVGRLDANFSQLDWLAAFVPQINRSHGVLVTQIELGQHHKPPLWGSLQIDQAGFEIPALGINVTDMSLHGFAQPTGELKLEANAKTGGGPTQILARGQWQESGEVELSATLNGENLHAVNLPQTQIWLNPKLNLELKPNKLHVGGELTIPKAQITVSQLPKDAVEVSADEIIEVANQNETNNNQQQRPKFSADVNLILGEQVQFRALDLKTKLAGKLRLEQDTQNTRATGKIRITEGNYQAYGQDLAIDEGYLLFQGPVDDPGLVIDASRQVEDIKVGLRLRGTLKQPRATTFSQPHLPETETLALLFTGKRLGATSDQDSAALIGAITTFGFEKSGGLVQQIQQQFGVDELGVTKDQSLQQTSVFIGKYLTPKLYARHSVGLIDNAKRFILEYSLTPNISIQAETTGTRQIMDILYEFEH